MRILLVAATKMEISPFLKARPSTDYLITGVGSAITVYQIAKRLQQQEYDLVLQAGIGGAFENDTKLDAVVWVKRDRFADLGMIENKIFSDIFAKGFADENAFPFKNGWLQNDNPFLQQSSLEKVNGITINTVTDDTVLSGQLMTSLAPVIETMEGAALHYVCLQEKKPFLQLRAVSNYVGERDKSKWKMKEAIDQLNKELLKAVHMLVNDTQPQLAAK